MSDQDAVGRLAVDAAGNELLSFARGAEGRPPDDAPLPLALVALWHCDRVLMVLDRFRQQWELPGGMIESGESAREAAMRELSEETGQQPDLPLRFVGHVLFALGEERRVEYGALFAGRIAAPSEVEPNEEIEAARWWDPTQRLSDGPPSLDAYLVWLTQ